MTARWVVDEVAPHRDVNVTWQPISLLFKNEPPEDSDYYRPVARTHKLLRVMESVRTTDGNEGVFSLYWELGRRIHHDQELKFTAAEALETAGLSTDHGAAYDDERWDITIRERMDIGLELAGSDVGTPIIAFKDDNGDKTALFGPVITRVPPTEQALKLWDGFIAVATVPGFWELKRTRIERPEFGARP